MLLLKFFHQSHTWKSSGSRVMDQNAVNLNFGNCKQKTAGFLKI